MDFRLTDEQSMLRDSLQSYLRDRYGAEDRRAAVVTKARTSAAPKFAAAVRSELAELAMDGAQFEVRLEPRSDRGPSAPDTGW